MPWVIDNNNNIYSYFGYHNKLYPPIIKYSKMKVSMHMMPAK